MADVFSAQFRMKRLFRNGWIMRKGSQEGWLDMRVSTEKSMDSMGDTKCFKVKANDKTIMKLDKKKLMEEMSKIKAGRNVKKDKGILSKIIGLVTGMKSKG
jgi:hypothetical protein